MVKFRNRTLQILVATDVAARGIDVDDITHVIHLNIPDEMEFYTHRSGRTARAGKKGISIALISRRELSRIRQIEKSLKAPFTRMMIPTGPEVCQKQLIALMHKVHEVKVNEEDIEEFLPAVYDELKDLTKQELIKRFASLEFNRFLDYYKNAPDLNAEEGARNNGEERYITGDRFFINVGKMDGLDKSGILELIDDCSGVGKKFIGQIDIKGAYSFFEVEKAKSQDILNGFNKVEYQGRAVRVEVTAEKSSGGGRSRGGDSGGRRGGYSGKPRSEGSGSRSEGSGRSEGRSSGGRSSGSTGGSRSSDNKRPRFNKKW
jgi:ATP-dependent RNA helicase DeaD